MYSMVMMMAMAGSGDVASFGGRGGCHGSSSCCGAPAAVSHGCCGGHARMGWRAGHSCCGSTSSCCGAPAPTCCGAPVVAAAPVAAPVAVVATPCCAPAPTCCTAAPKCHTGLFARRRANSCCATNTSCCSAPVQSCCGSTGMVTMPAAEPAKEMPKPGSGSTTPKKDN